MGRTRIEILVEMRDLREGFACQRLGGNRD